MKTRFIAKCGQYLELHQIPDGDFCQKYCFRVVKEQNPRHLWVAEIHRTYESLNGDPRYIIIGIKISPVHVQFHSLESAFKHVAGSYWINQIF